MTLREGILDILRNVLGDNDDVGEQANAACADAILALVGEVIAQARNEGLAAAAEMVPMNWCDSLLSGKGVPLTPWGCPEIERLLCGIAARIRAAKEA